MTGRQTENRRWDAETDLLVIGAGAAGMTAALVGALEGLRVIICEKSDMVGGTTATSAGTVWIPGSRQSEADRQPERGKKRRDQHDALDPRRFGGDEQDGHRAAAAGDR